MNILLGITGSVAATLTPKIIEALQKHGEVRVIETQFSLNFRHIAHSGTVKFYNDRDEWNWDIVPTPIQKGRFAPDTQRHHYQKGDSILHIELRKWADVIIVAPLSANTLGKMANGLADNLLTSVLRAWDFNKPMIVAPAMNTMMWDHPVTDSQIKQLIGWGVLVMEPQSKMLACGDEGIGAMCSIDNIVRRLLECMLWQFPLYNTRGLPKGNHPGAFGYRRKHDVHTGVDLYCNWGDSVRAVEYGTVVNIIPFTGKKVIGKDGKPMDWWLDTEAVLVQGASGVVVYGEVMPYTSLKVGDVLKKGQVFAKVVPVLPEGKERPDIPGHSRCMLHLELYSMPYTELERWVWEGWELDKPQPSQLLDPTEKIFLSNPSMRTLQLP